MKIYLSILAVLVFSTASFSQLENRKVVVLDKEDKKPIEFAYIVDNYGIVQSISNHNGESNLLIDISNELKNSPFTIFRYGYQEYKFRYNIKLDTILLSPKIEILDEVVITPSNNNIIYYKYYFKTYDTKNGVIRRYIDGIVEYEVNRKKNKVNRKVLQYRSMVNDTIISNEKRGFIQVTYEGTSIPYYKLMSIYDFNKKYNEYTMTPLTEEGNELAIKDMRTGKNLGKIYLTYEGKEKSGYLLEENTSLKTRKAYGSEGQVLLRLEEEHYETENHYFLKNRQIVKKSLFRQKSKKEKFSEYISLSKLIFLESYGKSNDKSVKFKRDFSNYRQEFWNDNEYVKVSRPLVSIDELKENPNKKSP